MEHKNIDEKGTGSIATNSNSDLFEEYGPVKHVNGRRTLGPPKSWVGIPPDDHCELYVKKIPRNFTENILLKIINRFGKIYTIRLMMDFNINNRGYCYVKFVDQFNMSRALELLPRYFYSPGCRLEVDRSFAKSRLFANNIPKSLSEEEIERGFRELFPKISRVIFRNHSQDLNDGQQNRGFVFLDFPTHEDALSVKKQTTPGRIRKWDRDIRIVWANPEYFRERQNGLKATSSLFVKNIPETVSMKQLGALVENIVHPSELININRKGSNAFINMETRLAAEKVLRKLDNFYLRSYKLSVEFAHTSKNQRQTSKPNLKDSKDYDAELRLTCIANGWSTPFILFGNICETEKTQVAAIMIRGSDQSVHSMYFEVRFRGLIDIQSHICQVAYRIINVYGGLPGYNFVFRVEEQHAYIVGYFDLTSREPFKSCLNQIFSMHFEELYKLLFMIKRISTFSHEDIIATIQSGSYHNLTPTNYMLIKINANYRCKPQLSHNLDNTQLIFLLCCSIRRRNVYVCIPCSLKNSSSLVNSECSNDFQLMRSISLQPQMAQTVQPLNYVVFYQDISSNLNFGFPTNFNVNGLKNLLTCVKK